MVYPIANLTLVPFVRLFIKKVEGLENLPKEGAFIIAANHQSFFDDLGIPCVIIPVINKKVHFYTNRSFMKNFFLRKFLNWGGSIPVAVDKKLDSKYINEKAFTKAINYLGKGEVIGIFPEGHRSKDGMLLEAKTGVARLALAAKVPVLPVGIIGSCRILPKGKAVPRPVRCRIKIGRPIYLNECSSFDSIILKKTTKKIMDSIAELIGQKYAYE